MMREALLNGRDWGELTAQQKTHNLGPDSQAAMQRRMQAMVEAFDFMCDMQPDQAAGAVRRYLRPPTSLRLPPLHLQGPHLDAQHAQNA